MTEATEEHFHPHTCMTEITLLQEWILDGQAEEVQYTLVLGSTADVFTDLVPVIFVHFQTLQQE
jgi:hypothetical protein